MKFVTICSDSMTDLAGQLEHLKADGWKPCSELPAQEGRLWIIHLEKPTTNVPHSSRRSPAKPDSTD